jgi:HEAT repeat protein
MAPWLYDPKSQIDILKNEDYRLRSAAAFNLGNMGAQAAEALPALDKLAKDDPNLKVREKARVAAEKIRAVTGNSPSK